MKKITYVELGKYFLDISKGTILVGMIYPFLKGRLDYNPFLAIAIGVILSMMGLYWVNKGGKDNE